MKIKQNVWNIIFWIFIIIATILLVWRVFGSSPGVEALIAAVIGSEAAIWQMMYKHGRELTEIRKDLSYIKQGVDKIKVK